MVFHGFGLETYYLLEALLALTQVSQLDSQSTRLNSVQFNSAFLEDVLRDWDLDVKTGVTYYVTGSEKVKHCLWKKGSFFCNLYLDGIFFLVNRCLTL